MPRRRAQQPIPVLLPGESTWTEEPGGLQFMGSHDCWYAAAKSLQSFPTVCDPTDDSPTGSSVPGILQVRTLEWAAISFSNACMLSRFSHGWLCETPRTAAHQAPLSSGFSRQEYWSEFPVPSPNCWYNWVLIVLTSKCCKDWVRWFNFTILQVTGLWRPIFRSCIITYCSIL